MEDELTLKNSSSNVEMFYVWCGHKGCDNRVGAMVLDPRSAVTICKAYCVTHRREHDASSVRM